MIPFDVIVAVDLDDGIGKEGRLPWRIPEDMELFKRVTTETLDPRRQNAVLVGRKTWESIPARFRPLPERLNVVLSRQPDYAVPDGVLLFADLDHALAHLNTLTDIESVFVAGGAEIYEVAAVHDECRRIYLTRVYTHSGCDTFFPDVRGYFARVSQEQHTSREGLHFAFEVFDRV